MTSGNGERREGIAHRDAIECTECFPPSPRKCARKTSGEAAIAQQERQSEDQTLFVEARHGIVEEAKREEGPGRRRVENPGANW